MKEGNGVNFGIGLALLKNGVKGLGMELSVTRSNDATDFQISRPSI